LVSCFIIAINSRISVPPVTLAVMALLDANRKYSYIDSRILNRSSM